MNNLNATAKKLDAFFKFINVLLTIATVTLLAGMGIVVAAFLFDLPSEMVGSGYNTISIGPLELTIANAYAPNPRLVLVVIGIACALFAVVCFFTRLCVRCVRQILAPMIENQPFNSIVSTNLKKLSALSLILGIVIHCATLAEQVMTTFALDLPGLLISEKITHVTVNYTFDLTFLAFSAVLLLLSYVFQYGEQLQQLSDETL